MSIFDFLSEAGDYIFGGEMQGPLPEGVLESARPDVGGIFGNVSLDDVAKIAGAGANIFSGDKSFENRAVPTSGFNVIDPEVQAIILEAIKQSAAAPRPALPMRQMTQQEMGSGSIFVNPALKALQQYKNMKAAESTPQAQPQQPMGGQPAPIADDFGNVAPSQGQGSAAASPSPQDPFSPDALREIGYNPKTGTYTTSFGTTVSGQAGADAAALAKEAQMLKELLGKRRPTFNSEQIAREAGSYSGITPMRGGWTNPHTGYEVPVEDGLNALLSGDLEKYRQITAQAHADPTKRGFSDFLAPLVAGAILAPMGAGIAGTLTGAAGIGAGSTLSNLASQLGKYGTRQVMRAAQ